MRWRDFGLTGGVRKTDIRNIKPYERNARKNDEAVRYVAESIRQFGFRSPIIVDGNGVIIAGHTRWKAARSLGMEDVPVIVADDLTPEQVKAYRLADNKVGEIAQWDFGLLDEEVADLEGFGLEAFGFEFQQPDPAPRDNERKRTDDAYNLALVDDGDLEGPWQLPVIRCDGFIPDRLQSFNYAKTSDDKACGIHFFIDDYQFERVWNAPEKYVDVLRQYECALSPDFSLYMDMPRAMKLWNVYRSRAIGAYWQAQGLKVVPTVSWAEPETFAWCFDGIPSGSIVAVSTVGVKRSKDSMRVWREGMDAMLERLEPSTVLVYGGEVAYDYGNAAVRHFENKVTERMRKGRG